jgi:RNA polymerase sigma factor (sigma-70 family)
VFRKDNSVPAKGGRNVPRRTQVEFRLRVISTDWFLSPIVSLLFPWNEKESHSLRPNRCKRFMNSTDQFEMLVSDHYEPLFRFAMSLTRAESDAWDLTQHTFYVWAKKGHQLRDLSKARTWLFTTLHRAFLEGRRRRSRFPHDDWEEVSEQLPAFSPELADHVDASQVLSALARVDEVYQAAVALNFVDDCSYQEIAEILEVPVGTVKSRIARGITQIREILGLVETEPASASVNRPDHAEGSRRENTGGALAWELAA